MFIRQEPGTRNVRDFSLGHATGQVRQSLEKPISHLATFTLES